MMVKNCYEVHLILLQKAQSEEEKAGQQAKNQNQKELLIENGTSKGKGDTYCRSGQSESSMFVRNFAVVANFNVLIVCIFFCRHKLIAE